MRRIVEFVNDSFIITAHKIVDGEDTEGTVILLPNGEEKYFIQALFEGIDDPNRSNLKNILNVIANNKDYQNPTILKRLADRCFASKIKSIWENIEDDLTEIMSDSDMIEYLQGIKHTMQYDCEDNLQTLYAIELLSLRAGYHIKQCEFCGEYFIYRSSKYCSKECATKVRRKQEAQSHKELPEDVKLWRMIQQRLWSRIRRQTNEVIKNRLEAELKALKEEKQLMRDRPKEQYIKWLHQVDSRTSKEK